MVRNEKTTSANTNRWADLLLLAVAFLMLFWGLGGRTLWGSEGRWAEIAREMLITKDFFHPTIGGLPYFDKPLLTYWLIASFSVMFGTLTEGICRLPSALCGVITVFVTMQIGKRLWSAQVGRIAGWILLTTYGVLLWSRTAAADTKNLAAIMVCTAWYWARRDKPGFVTFFVFYLVMVLGALTKGLAAVAIPILVVLPDIIENKRWRMLLSPSHFFAAILALLLYVAPFVYSSSVAHSGYQASGLGMVFRENIQRFYAPFDHKEPFWVYFKHTPTLFLPWSVLLILALIAIIPRWKQLDDKTKWLLKAAALIFLFFTASGSRRNYYILPLIPFCALLTAVFLTYIRDAKVDALRKLGLDIQQVVLGVIIALELASPLIVPIAFKIMKKPDIELPHGIYTACISIGIAALVVWIVVYIGLKRAYGQPQGLPLQDTLKRELPTTVEPRLMAIVGVTAVLFGGFFCWQMNMFEYYRMPEKAFIAQLKEQTAAIAPQQVGFFISNNRSSAETLFYLDKPGLSTIIKDVNGLKDFLQGQPPRAIISLRKGLPDGLEAQLAKFPKIEERGQQWEDVKEQGKKRIAWILNEPVTVTLATDFTENKKKTAENAEE
ncbi:MAG: glycosyltransferase family 39 protein [Sedimentisphaerales bacterium]|nr:glycosyltransferase family 39 protein [Sedimentisphaerales bacterium]